MNQEELQAIKNLFLNHPELQQLEFKKEGRGWNFAINGQILSMNLIFPPVCWQDSDKSWLVENNISSELVINLRKGDIIPPRPFCFTRESFE